MTFCVRLNIYKLIIFTQILQSILFMNIYSTMNFLNQTFQIYLICDSFMILTKIDILIQNKIINRMSKVSSKLLHISSQEQQSDNQKDNEKKEAPKIKQAQSLKYNTFKAGSAQIKENIFKSTSNIDQYVIQQSKKSGINYISENVFQIKSDTIIKEKQNYQQSNQDEEQDKSTRKLVDQLNKMNLTCAAKPENQSKNICQRKKSNLMMQISLQDYSDEEQNSNIRVTNMRQKDDNQEQDQRKDQTQQQHSRQQSSQDNDRRQSTKQRKLREVEWDPTSQSKEEFIQRRMRDSERLSVIIQRDKSGMNFFLPKFDMVYKKDLRHLAACKKQVGTNFQYIISTSSEIFQEKSGHFMGKIVGNFTNTLFNLIDCTGNLICTTKFREQAHSKIAAPKIYDIYTLNENQRYSQLLGANKQCTKGLDQLCLYPINKKKISYFINKKPQFNEKVQAYMLNFNGRVSKGSIKNFIIEDSKSGREVLMFGRGPGEMFNLDISQPFTPLIALGVIIPHFASKVLQN